MALPTGENEQGLRNILDQTRLISIGLLLLHGYYYGYGYFRELGWTSPISDRLLWVLTGSGLFDHPLRSKGLALLLLLITLLGVRGKKTPDLRPQRPLLFIAMGLVLYFGSTWVPYGGLSLSAGTLTYLGLSGAGYLMVLSGGALLSRIITVRLKNTDVFNRENETFPQEERLLRNPYSVNLPALYKLKGRWRKSWINIINPFRGLLVLGSPGSGKSYYVIRHVITQHLQKGFALFVYDFKFDDLSRIAYNHFLKYQEAYPAPPRFYAVSFDELSLSHRCNPLAPDCLQDVSDAVEAARTILLGLNRDWIRRQGDFFIESAINLLTAVIWFLRRHEEGKYCTLPHVIELMQVEYDSLFTVLRTEPEIEAFVGPFIAAYVNDVGQQLEGQMASARVTLARLSSPRLYWVLSGSDFTLDINNPQAPKIVCVGNSPQKQQVYGAVVSLIVSTMIRLVNRRGGVPASLIFDEFPMLFVSGMDALMATARSNRVATTLGVQDVSQLRKDYGRDGADVLMGLAGNVIAGQVSGDTARSLSDRFGKILQDRASLSVNSTDTSTSLSRQLELAVPPSRIATLSVGELVGVVADDPGTPIDQKVFHARVVNDHKRLKKEQENYKPLPEVQQIDLNVVQQNYLTIKEDIATLVR